VSRVITALRSDAAQIALYAVIAVVLTTLISTKAIGSYIGLSIGVASVYGILVLAVSLLAGWAGIPSFAHAGLLAVGAYAAAFGSRNGWSFEQTVLIAMAITAALGAALGFIGSRFSELYAGLLTIAFALIVLEVINNWSEITGGDEGRPVSSLTSITGAVFFASSQPAIVLAIVVFVVCLAIAVVARRLTLRLRTSAAKSHTVAARSIGISPPMQFTLAFAVSGAFGGLAGVLFGLTSGFVSPDSFSLNFAALIVAAAVLGGFGSVAGAIVGGAFMSLASVLANSIGVNQQLIEGIVLIAVLLLLPLGLVPSLNRLARRLLRRFRVGAGLAPQTAALARGAEE